MNDDRLTTALGSFYKGTAPTPPDPVLGLERVMTRVRKTRQRGRWWPLPIFGRARAMPSAIPAPEYRSTPVPATNGYPTTITRRTHVMFSPVKAITAGALAFTLGGVLLIAQPFDQQGGSLPGAATDADAVTDPMAPAFVTGSITQGSPSSWGTASTDEYGAMVTTGFVGPAEWEASDPRLSGTDTYTGNWRRFATAGFTVSAATRVVENGDGRWVGTVTGLEEDRPDFSSDTIILHGEDAYEGLTAYVLIDYKDFPSGEFFAAIFPGEMPPFPEPAE